MSGPNGTFSYSYDPLGYQISSTVNGQTTNNLIDPFGLGNVAAQFDSSGNLVAHYTYGLGLVSQVSASGTAYYYDYNLQGSTVGITNAAGVYVNQYSYDPFGQVTTISAGIANPFTFVGQDGVSSDGNGLIYMRARYYDPSTGQFVSNDPLGLAGGDTNTSALRRERPDRLALIRCGLTRIASVRVRGRSTRLAISSSQIRRITRHNPARLTWPVCDRHRATYRLFRPDDDRPRRDVLA